MEPMISSETFDLIVFGFVVYFVVAALAGLIYDALFGEEEPSGVFCDPDLPESDEDVVQLPRSRQ